MKKSIYFLSILILFQSCYSYKTFDIKNYEIVKPRKVKIELKNSLKYKGNIISYKNDTLVLKKIIGTIAIPIAKIKKVRKRKISWLKTIGFIYATMAIMLVSLIAIALSSI